MHVKMQNFAEMIVKFLETLFFDFFFFFFNILDKYEI